MSDNKLNFKDQYENFIGGSWIPPKDGEYFENPSPIDGNLICKIPRSNQNDIELAVQSAWKAAATWNRTSAAERSIILSKIADRIEENLEYLALHETWENGKAIRETMSADIPLTVDHFRYFGSAIRTESGETSDLDASRVTQEIFEPLAMTDTYFYIPKEKHERLVAVQTLENGNWVDSSANPFYEPNYPITGAQTFFSGGAGLSSTALDYAQFLQMYINGGELNGKRILSPTTVDFILSNQIGDIWADQGAGHGLAFKVVGEGASDKGGQGSPGTFEWGGYFNTQYFADPQQKLIGIIMKQTLGANNDPTAWKFRNIVFSSVAE